LILSPRSGRQCPAIFIENFIEKDKCNHIAPVPAQLLPHSLIIAAFAYNRAIISPSDYRV
jgi:hypothetical protein